MKAFKKIKYLFKLMFKVSPSFIFLTFFGAILKTINVLGNVILPKYLIDDLIINKDLKSSLIWGAILVGFNLIINFISKTYNKSNQIKEVYVSKKIMEEMSKKIMKVEYHYLENPYYLDLKERAIFACRNQRALENLVALSTGIITDFMTIISLMAVMLALGYLLLSILLVGVIITIVINYRFMKYQVDFFQSIIPINRKYNYYFRLVADEKISKDIRLYNMGPLIFEKVRHYNKLNMDNFKRYYKNWGIMLGVQHILTVLQTGLVYLYVAYRVSRDGLKRITIGEFTMYANAAINFSRTFNSLFDNVINMMQILDYLDPFVEFMQLPDAISQHSEIKIKEINKIEFRNVSFTYPKTKQLILDDVSFKIDYGQKISIVGLNGAGKTTLIKLLCRFYKPDQGQILVNDIDIFTIDYKSYLESIAIVFQDYKLFAYSIAKNIIGEDEVDLEKIKNITNLVGLSEVIDKLPNGFDTKLNKSYDENGLELSGGQGQKLAIARALYKDASLVILDEPTSALDPIAEAEIYHNFNNLVMNKTAIYISHRMSSSVFCDFILVLDNGKIVSYDTHNNLMKNHDSLYYKLFTTQSENYQLN